MSQADVLLARRVLKVQAVLGAIISCVGVPFGSSIALSAFIGASACLLANALFVSMAFRGYRAQAPERIVMRFYGAEVAKIALILAIFAIALIALNDLNFPVLMGAYFVTQVASPIIAAQTERPRNLTVGNRTQK